MKTDVLIIGGGIAGTTAAETFRAGNPDASITIISLEQHALYSRVLLPYAVKGKITDEKVYLKTDDFYAESHIEYLTGVRVTDVDPAKKTVTVSDGSSVEFGKLLIATGGAPKVWKVPGSDLEGILHLQTYEDIADIRKNLDHKGDMVIVGTGFIAMEFASFAVHAGIKATIINRGAHFCSSVFGEEMGHEVQNILEEKGITIIDNAHIERVLGETEVRGVKLSDGHEIPCATIGLGIGLDLSIDAFEKVGVSTGVLADASLKSAHSDIWVAGDCCEFEDPLLGFRHVVGNWTNAMAQGRHVAKAMLGEEKTYEQLTAYTSMCMPGAALIYLGETRAQKGVEREIKMLESEKVIELHKKDGQNIGAILLNAPAHRKILSEAITARSKKSLEELLV